MTPKSKIIGFVFFLCLISFFQLKNINNKVTERHAWANADHYAIAIGFTNNNFDFFHPETFCLNPQFKASLGQKQTYTNSQDYWDANIKDPKGITAIDCPIHQYAVSILMTIFKSTSPWIYRLYILLISMIGLFFLFKALLLINKSYLISSLLILFIYLSPTYNYYCFQFLPTAASLSLIFIAFYHYIKYLKDKNQSNWLLCLVFILIASLTRLPFIMYALALFGHYFILGIIEKKIAWKKLLGLSFIILIVGAYFLYNKLYLAKFYGSNFLNYPLYPKNFEDIYYSIKETIYYESWRYFTPIHYFILVLLFIKFIIPIKNTTFNKNLIGLYLLCGGVTTYSLLMLKQFPAHDYYLLDTFFPLVIIIISLISKQIHFDFLKVYVVVAIMLSIVFLLIITDYGYRTREKSPLTKTINNFTGADKILDSLQITPNQKILLLDSYSPNGAFIEMKRKGFCVMVTKPEVIKRALKWDFDYIITQNFTYKEDILKSYPNFENETTLFYKNNNFSIYQLKNHDTRIKKNQ
ncbi:hypothetical protein AXE80_04190 [Wenyingzhuangia fucanilytica]|uniref:Glycosyltransferase RgtA/B/C/D-like domain-containing protein n=1 Tax=Wenyingzhuangia fucanilytica TaxID=1790137 RepID=A0A1B1Y460_9FLAO|nr:glycosyltransferase family 39 protein [Wenyingzhuangia fucanilytica]ANW95529.1 hypothetical protein AXE80_04190 [Wenyingzhuangia fucanilytica]